MSLKQGDSFLHYNLKLMRTIGLWPLDSKSAVTEIMYNIYTAIMAILLAVVSVGQMIEIFVSPNISSMASAVDLATLTASALFKMIYIIWYRKEFQELVVKIDSTFYETDFFIGKFHMTSWLKYSKLFINIYVSMAWITIIPFFVIAPYLSAYLPFLDSLPIKNPQADILIHKRLDDSSMHNFNLNITQEGFIGQMGNFKSSVVMKKRKFPVNCWFPFDVTWSPLYEIVYFIELFPLIGSGHLYLVSDAFFFMIIYMACGQLELLKCSLRGIQKKYANYFPESFYYKKDMQLRTYGALSKVSWSKDEQIEREMEQDIIKCVDFHSNTLSIIHDLDLTLRSMIVVDFLHAVISLSFAMLQTITSNSLYEWIQMILFIGVSVLHQFLNNFFCEILMQQQASVGDAAYELPWVEGSAQVRTAVYMTVAQSRHITRLSGWKMYLLGLNTFVEFIKLLASYFLVLQSLHADESMEKKI